MNNDKISNLRLFNQFLTRKDTDNIEDLVSKMGALQAQDYYMVKWAVGTRLTDSTIDTFDTAINNAKIIRTHLLRPTWHIVASTDIYWLLDLTAQQIKNSMRSRDKELELDDIVYKKCNKIIVKALSAAGSLTREELVPLLEEAKIFIGNNRAYHIFLRAELDGLICSGVSKDKQWTYALLEERVPYKNLLTKEEALYQLAKKYFITRGPATLQDFIWWSGLSSINAKQALESIKSEFDSEKVNSQVYWFKLIKSKRKIINNKLYLLPAFDEFIISYKNRSAVFVNENHRKVVLRNGLFKPVVVLNGEVIGSWKHITKKDKKIIEVNFFDPMRKAPADLIEDAIVNFSRFIKQKTEFKVC